MKSVTRAHKSAGITDPLVGRSYLCCSGTKRGETVTVIGLNEKGDRYRVEAERGSTWTITIAKLRRIFGASAKRACQCHPIDATESEVIAAPADSPEEAAVLEVDEASAAADIIEASTVEAIVKEVHRVEEPLVPTVIHHEANAQGRLF